eukprot:scaffold22595_cov63-Phaeocystis_antarctica.AAC.10
MPAPASILVYRLGQSFARSLLPPAFWFTLPFRPIVGIAVYLSGQPLFSFSVTAVRGDKCIPLRRSRSGRRSLYRRRRRNFRRRRHILSRCLGLAPIHYCKSRTSLVEARSQRVVLGAARGAEATAGAEGGLAGELVGEPVEDPVRGKGMVCWVAVPEELERWVETAEEWEVLAGWAALEEGPEQL